VCPLLQSDLVDVMRSLAVLMEQQERLPEQLEHENSTQVLP
jgi:hypothetical protein